LIIFTADAIRGTRRQRVADPTAATVEPATAAP
jgi:hypothetical protein